MGGNPSNYVVVYLFKICHITRAAKLARPPIAKPTALDKPRQEGRSHPRPPPANPTAPDDDRGRSFVSENHNNSEFHPTRRFSDIKDRSPKARRAVPSNDSHNSTPAGNFGIDFINQKHQKNYFNNLFAKQTKI